MGEAKALSSSSSPEWNKTVKIGIVGDTQVGKTSLVVRYIEGYSDLDYIQTLAPNIMEKFIIINQKDVMLCIWDLGGHLTSLHMLPKICEDAFAILFTFDLTRLSTLEALDRWYEYVRMLNKTTMAFLIGTKYDYFCELPTEEKIHTVMQARLFAKRVNAPLIFCSSFRPTNVEEIFRIVLSKALDLPCDVKLRTLDGDPIVEY